MSMVDEWNFVIPATNTEEETDSKKKYTVYYVVVCLNSSIWSVKRRFKNFIELQSKFQNNFPDIPLKLPSRKLTNINKFKKEFIEQRRVQLEDYLKQLKGFPKLLETSYFSLFIDKEQRYGFKKVTEVTTTGSIRFTGKCKRNPDIDRIITGATQSSNFQSSSSSDGNQHYYWVKGMKLQVIEDISAASIALSPTQIPFHEESKTEPVNIAFGTIVTFLGEIKNANNSEIFAFEENDGSEKLNECFSISSTGLAAPISTTNSMLSHSKRRSNSSKTLPKVSSPFAEIKPTTPTATASFVISPDITCKTRSNSGLFSLSNSPSSAHTKSLSSLGLESSHSASLLVLVEVQDFHAKFDDEIVQNHHVWLPLEVLKLAEQSSPNKGLQTPTMVASSPPRIGKYRSASDQDISWLAETQTLDEECSQETLVKVNNAKNFFEEYYANLYYYLNQRRQRLQMLELKLGELGYKDEEEKKRLLEKHFQKETQLLRRKRKKLKLEDFEILERIGKGGFGKVYLCRDKFSNEIVALKKISKSIILERNKVEAIRTERDVLKESVSRESRQHENPWLIKLICSFQDTEYLYLAMEYAPGGDLKGLLESIQFDEKSAKFYISEIIVALASLHELGFVHRDLKPDNFLFDKDGHIKLADFGLSKGGIIKKTSTANVSLVKIFMEDSSFRTIALTQQHTTEQVIDLLLKKMHMDDQRGLDKSKYSLYEVNDDQERLMDSQEIVYDSFDSLNANLDTFSSFPERRFLLKNSDTSKVKKTSSNIKPSPTGRSKADPSNTRTIDLNVVRQRRILSKKWSKKEMYSFVGSPHYMAPEIIMRVGYDELVDWWSVGCILYELIIGFPPFLGESPQEVFNNILDHEHTLQFPEENDEIQMSIHCKDFIKRLLSPAASRLGKGGLPEFTKHSFLQDVDWKNLRNQTPPFVPQLSSPTDTSYFHLNEESGTDNKWKSSGESPLTSKESNCSSQLQANPVPERKDNSSSSLVGDDRKIGCEGDNNAGSMVKDDIKERFSKKGNHKRNNSYDFVGFTFKPQSWMDIGELREQFSKDL